MIIPIHNVQELTNCLNAIRLKTLEGEPHQVDHPIHGPMQITEVSHLPLTEMESIVAGFVDSIEIDDHHWQNTILSKILAHNRKENLQSFLNH